jgi:hypothetical protein
MAVTLVIAWDTDLKEPLEARRSVNMRHGKQIAEELEKAYPGRHVSASTRKLILTLLRQAGRPL